MIFWFLIATVTIAIGSVAFFPLWKKSQTTPSTQRNDLNKAFYFDRLQEVEREEREGKIDDLAQTKLELQQSLLDDIPLEPEEVRSEQKSYGKVWFVSLILLIGAVGSTIYLNIGSWFAGTMLEKSHEKLGYFYERIQQEQDEPLTNEELNQFAVALRLEVQKNPQDHRAWFFLGQAGMATENPQLALDAFRKASRLQPENTHYQLRYAQILMFSDDPRDKEEGEKVVKNLIRLDHTNTEALSMLAFHYFEKEDYKMAAMTWGMMLKLMPEDDPRRPTIERSIQSALGMMKEEPSTEPKSQ